MKIIFNSRFKLLYYIKKVFYRLLIMPGLKESLGKCGKNVYIFEHSYIKPFCNIYIGDDCSIGRNATFLSTKAKIIIKNGVMMGPNVTIITGNHRTDLIGKRMIDVTEKEKNINDDEDVIIEEDVWIGTNVTILKGVKIERGAVIAAGSVVTKNVEQYSIYAGIPAKKIKYRFTEKQLEEHKKILKELSN